MKLLVLSVLFFASCCFAELRRDDVWPPPMVLDYLKPLAKTCVDKTGATAEAIKQFSDGDLHDDPKLKCYMNCLFSEANMLDENGDVHFEKIQTHVDRLDQEIRDIASNFVQNCKKIEGSDPCERAFSVHKCWKLHDPKFDRDSDSCDDMGLLYASKLETRKFEFEFCKYENC